MKPGRPGIGAWLTRLEFGKEERLFFLTRLGAMNRAGIALRSIFESLAHFPSSSAERRLSRYSLANISMGRPFAEGYDTGGWFDARMTALLVVGEEHQCLDRVLSALTNSDQHKLSFWHAVVWGNLRWFVSVIIAFMICTVLYTQQHLFIQVLGAPQGWAQHSVFALGAALWNYGHALLFVTGLAALWFYYRLYHCADVSRCKKDNVGIYRVFRRQFALRLLPELAELIVTGMGPAAALELCVKIYPTTYYRHRLTAISTALATGTELLEALAAHLLEPRYAALASSVSVSYPGEPQRALLDIHRVMRADTINEYRVLARRLSFGMMALLLWLIYGVLEVVYAIPPTIR